MEFKKSLDELREEFYKKIKNEGGSIDEILTVIREMQQKYEVESVEWNLLQEIYESELGADQKERGIDAMKGIREALEKIFQRKPEISAENFNEHYGETHVVVTSHSPGAVLAQSNVDMPKDPLQPHVIQMDMSGNKKVVPITRQESTKQNTTKGSEPPADVPAPNPEPTTEPNVVAESAPLPSNGDLARNTFPNSALSINALEDLRQRYLHTLFSKKYVGEDFKSPLENPVQDLIAMYKQLRYLMELPLSNELRIEHTQEVIGFMRRLHMNILRKIREALDDDRSNKSQIVHLLHTFNIDTDDIEKVERKDQICKNMHEYLLQPASDIVKGNAEIMAQNAMNSVKKQIQQEKEMQEEQDRRENERKQMEEAEASRRDEEERREEEARQRQQSAEKEKAEADQRKSDKEEKAKRKTEQPWSAPLPTMKSTEYVNELLRKYPEESSMYGRAIRRLLRMRGWKGEDPGASSSQMSASKIPSTIPMPQNKQPAGPQEKPKDANSKTSVESKKQAA